VDSQLFSEIVTFHKNLPEFWILQKPLENGHVIQLPSPIGFGRYTL